MSIPKVIHYCWFGKGEMPKLAKKCIKSWEKYCPDYEIICHNEDNFDIANLSDPEKIEALLNNATSLQVMTPEEMIDTLITMFDLAKPMEDIGLVIDLENVDWTKENHYLAQLIAVIATNIDLFESFDDIDNANFTEDGTGQERHGDAIQQNLLKISIK